MSRNAYDAVLPRSEKGSGHYIDIDENGTRRGSFIQEKLTELFASDRTWRGHCGEQYTWCPHPLPSLGFPLRGGRSR